MMPQLSETLKPHVKRVLAGDILNLPLLHRTDMERILYYCIAFLNSKIDKKEQLLYDRLIEVDELKKEIKCIKQSLQHDGKKGKKWK